MDKVFMFLAQAQAILVFSVCDGAQALEDMRLELAGRVRGRLVHILLYPVMMILAALFGTGTMALI
jgi:hypothetical protein